MPIFEYACDACHHEFETLVRSGDTPACPRCAGTALTKQLSLPAIQSESTHGLAMRAAQKRVAAVLRDSGGCKFSCAAFGLALVLVVGTPCLWHAVHVRSAAVGRRLAGSPHRTLHCSKRMSVSSDLFECMRYPKRASAGVLFLF